MLSHTSGRRTVSVVISLVAPLALAAALTACGDSRTEASDATDPPTTTAAPTIPAPPTSPAPTAPPPTVVTDDQLDGRTFLSTATTGFELIDGTVLQIDVEDGFLRASAGCTSFGGAYVLDGNRISVETGDQPDTFCDQPLIDQDVRIAAWLASDLTIALDGDTLVLTAGDQSITFVDSAVADPDLAIEDTEWTLTGTFTAGSSSNVPEGTVSTLRITDGTAAVNTGCNSGSAAVTVGDGTLEFGPLALTRMACDPVVMLGETFISDVLSGTVTYEIEGSTLTIMNGTDGLQYEAQAAG